MIGVFDSGVGGLSVLKEIVPLIPSESYIYIADSGYCPYGPKSKEEIIQRAKLITDFLISKGANIIVVACNTATAAAISYLRSNYSIPFIGMEPAIKPAVLNSKSGVVGVLATRGTFKGELYLNTLNKFAFNKKVIEQVGEGLVELVEDNNVNSKQADSLLRSYILPMINAGADKLVLGCTHYPFLIDKIKDISGDRLEIINPAPYVAKHCKEVLDEISYSLEDPKFLYFYTTGANISILKKLSNDILINNCYENVLYDIITL